MKIEFFRGSEIDIDRKSVESKFKFLTHEKHCHKKKDKRIYTKSQAFKVHLLEQESIRTLYRNRLKGKLTPLTGETDANRTKSKCKNYIVITLLPTAYTLFENIIKTD